MSQPSVYTAHQAHAFSSSSSSAITLDSAPELDEMFLGRVFNWADENEDGKISPTELQHCLTAVGEEITEEEAKAMVESVDSDGDGYLEFEEFERLVGEEREGEEERRRRVKEAFMMYVGEEERCITPRSLQRTLSRLGETRTIEDCRMMIERFDLNGDGVLSLDEFAAMVL